MPGTDDFINLLGRLGELKDGVATELLGLSIPELLKDVVEGMDGLDVSASLQEAIGGLGQVLGPEILGTLVEFGGSLKDAWDLGGGAGIVEQVTKSVESLQQFKP